MQNEPRVIDARTATDLLPFGMRQSIPHEVDPATLPSRIQHLANGRLDALMGIDDKLHTSQATPRQLAQELCPDRLGLGRADLQPKPLPAIGIDADSDDGCDRNDASAASETLGSARGASR